MITLGVLIGMLGWFSAEAHQQRSAARVLCALVGGCVKAREVGAEIWRSHAPVRFPRRAFCF
jgi:hypothetical protein